MKTKKPNRVLSMILTVVMVLTVGGIIAKAYVDPNTQNTPLTGGTLIQYGIDRSRGNISDTPYHYEIWVDEGGAAGASLRYFGDQGGGAAFRADWTEPNDYLGRTGYYWNNGGPYTQYKNIYADFNYTRSGQGTGGEYSYIGIYGWTRNPLIEYYIVEDWFGNRSQDETTPITTKTTGGSVVGSFTVDGSIYDIIRSERVEKPSIDGTKTFTQIFSVRRTPRKSGTISVTEHFKKWEELGLPFGNRMYECKFLVEVGGGTGWLEHTYLSFSQEDEPRDTLKIEEIEPGVNTVMVMLTRALSDNETLIVAVYDSDGRLLRFETVTAAPTDITAGKAIPVTIDTNGEAATIKAMVWEDSVSMQPLCRAEEKPIQQIILE